MIAPDHWTVLRSHGPKLCGSTAADKEVGDADVGSYAPKLAEWLGHEARLAHPILENFLGVCRPLMEGWFHREHSWLAPLEVCAGDRHSCVMTDQELFDVVCRRTKSRIV